LVLLQRVVRIGEHTRDLVELRHRRGGGQQPTEYDGVVLADGNRGISISTVSAAVTLPTCLLH
jgi:hypothetical protein